MSAATSQYNLGQILQAVHAQTHRAITSPQFKVVSENMLARGEALSRYTQPLQDFQEKLYRNLTLPRGAVQDAMVAPQAWEDLQERMPEESIEPEFHHLSDIGFTAGPVDEETQTDALYLDRL